MSAPEVRRLCDHGFSPATCAELEGRPEVRVLLVKPGDVLLIGNVGDLAPDLVTPVIEKLRDLIGIRVVMFSEDITIGDRDSLWSEFGYSLEEIARMKAALDA